MDKKSPMELHDAFVKAFGRESVFDNFCSVNEKCGCQRTANPKGECIAFICPEHMKTFRDTINPELSTLGGTWQGCGCTVCQLRSKLSELIGQFIYD